MNQHGILTYVKMFIAFPYNKTIHWTHEKKGILSHFWKLRPIDPTKQHVEHMERFRMSSDAWDFRPFDPARQMV